MARKTVIKVCLGGAGVIASLGLAALLLVQHHTISALREEVLAFQAQQKVEDRLPAEKQRAPQATERELELQQLRENTHDLMRLRNEVHALREKSGELETLRAANTKLLAAIQDAGRSNTAVITTSALRQGARLGILMGAASASPDGVAVSSGPAGVIVTAIEDDSAAADSDLRPMDVIMAVDGRRVTTPPELQIEMLTKQPGQTVLLDVVRTGAVLRVEIKTRPWPR